MHTWPDTFDFRTDRTCQNVFLPFIHSHINMLKKIDEQRPDTASYIFHEHSERVAEDVKNTCLTLGLNEQIAYNMYWAALPHDIGKVLLPVELWDLEQKPEDSVKKLRRTHTLLGVQIVTEILNDYVHPFKDLLIDVMAYHHEHLDGTGTHGKTTKELSSPVRLIAIVEAFDGYSIHRPHFGDRDISAQGVLEKMAYEKGPSIYDFELLKAFAEMKGVRLKEWV